MWDKILDSADMAAQYIHRLNLTRENWIVISVVVLVAGMVFLRGFGSRTNY